MIIYLQSTQSRRIQYLFLDYQKIQQTLIGYSVFKTANFSRQCRRCCSAAIFMIRLTSLCKTVLLFI